MGNKFQELASVSYASRHPTSVSPGNHEACGSCPQIPGEADSRGNFSEYRARFHSVEAGAGKASGSGSSIFYSFDLGLTHYISFSAESYAYRSGPELLANQLAFMKADLAAVDRKVTPWVVALVHKDWNMEAEAYADFYPILDAGKVDALFCGHIQLRNTHTRRQVGCSRTPLSPPPLFLLTPLHTHTLTHIYIFSSVQFTATTVRSSTPPCRFSFTILIPPPHTHSPPPPLLPLQTVTFPTMP